MGPEYSMETQAQIPAALSAIHNFIRIHDPEDGVILEEEEEYVNQGQDAGDNFIRHIGIVDDNMVVQRRDSIAQAM